MRESGQLREHYPGGKPGDREMLAFLKTKLSFQAKAFSIIPEAYPNYGLERTGRSRIAFWQTL